MAVQEIPPAWKGFATAYLWERVWSRDSVLNLIQQFIHVVEEEDDKGRKTGERSLFSLGTISWMRCAISCEDAQVVGTRPTLSHST